MNKTLEEILDKYDRFIIHTDKFGDCFPVEKICRLMEEYGKQQYNQGVLDTMKNVVELSLLKK